MELPIQLKFFKKLELYQEVKFQDKKSIGASERLRKVWATEKLILGWTAWGHHLIAHPINHEYVREGLLLEKNESDYDFGLSATFTNLIIRGLAMPVDEDPSNILFTSTGLLMGEVINDVEGKKLWSRVKYNLFFHLVWITAIFGALLVVGNFFVFVYKTMLTIFNFFYVRH